MEGACRILGAAAKSAKDPARALVPQPSFSADFPHFLLRNANCLFRRVMDPLMISAASGMRSRMESLDMLANNLANANTAGYKLDREFYSLYASPDALGPALDGTAPAPSVLPVIDRPWTDFSQGALTPTGNPLDLALGKTGFFAVNGPGGTLYTRNGSFQLSSDGTLVTSEGYAVRGADGKPIQADPSRPIEITPDGALRQNGSTIGQIAVVGFERPEALEKFGNNYFRAGAAAGPKPAAEVAIHQGKLESSNVAAAESAVRLVSIMRQFEMLQRAMMLGGEMARKDFEEVARVNG
jgi:flagellar basal-body rod protein FlgF